MDQIDKIKIQYGVRINLKTQVPWLIYHYIRNITRTDI
jgi:hypothetical protein